MTSGRGAIWTMYFAGVLLCLGFLSVYGPTYAGARTSNARHLTCDDPTSPDYPILAVSPGSCDLGLAESSYQVQPDPEKPVPPAIELRQLRWRHWGQRQTTGRGRACLAFTDECAGAVISAWDPTRILPAAGLLIYQHIKVRSGRIAGGPRVIAWYVPGLDY